MAFLLREHMITTICFLNAHSIGHGINSQLTPTLVVDQLLIWDIVFCAQAVSRHATFTSTGGCIAGSSCTRCSQSMLWE